MANFVGKYFKGILGIIISIEFLGVAILGYHFIKINFVLAIAIWIVGFIVIILTHGLISIIINIDGNIEKYKYKHNRYI
jgi:hypothetical protein